MKQVINIQSVNGHSFLSQPMGTHIKFAKLLSFLVLQFNKSRFPVNEVMVEEKSAICEDEEIE